MTEPQVSPSEYWGNGKVFLTEVRDETLGRKGDFLSRSRKVALGYTPVVSAHLPSIEEFRNFSATQMTTQGSDFLDSELFDQPRGKTGSPESLCPHLSDFHEYSYVMRLCAIGQPGTQIAVTSPLCPRGVTPELLKRQVS